MPSNNTVFFIRVGVEFLQKTTTRKTDVYMPSINKSVAEVKASQSDLAYIKKAIHTDKFSVKEIELVRILTEREE